MYVLMLYTRGHGISRGDTPGSHQHADQRAPGARAQGRADLNGETLTGFVLSVATERAEEVVERAQRIDLGNEAFRRFVEALDAPIEQMPTLRRYAHKRSPIPKP